MTALALQSFGFGAQLVRAVRRDGLAWFVANDVCAVLEIANPRNATARLEDDERGVCIVDTLGGQQELTIVSESGVYALIFRSRKPAARAFRKWVTSEVLPAIRETGQFAVHGAPRGPTALSQLPQTPDEYENFRARLQMVREARIAFGTKGARRAWRWVGLPDLSEGEDNGLVPPDVASRYPDFATWFEERVRIEDGVRTSADRLWRDYEGWAASRGVSTDEGTKLQLGKFLSAARVPSLKSNGVWRIGIALR